MIVKLLFDTRLSQKKNNQECSADIYGSRNTRIVLIDEKNEIYQVWVSKRYGAHQ
jgi:hypothetical protein